MIDPPPPLYAPGEEASYDDGDVEESLVSFNSMEEMMNASIPSPFGNCSGILGFGPLAQTQVLPVV